MVQATSSITGKGYSLPYYALHGVDNPMPVSGRTLDTNHDAALAAAYSVMARYMLDDRATAAQAAGKADAYLASATDLAKSGKCLPLVDLPKYQGVCDTGYNGFWRFLLEAVARTRPQAEAAHVTDIQFAFAKDSILSFETQQNFPQTVSGSYPDPVEPMLWMTTAARSVTTDEFRLLVTRTNDLIVNGTTANWRMGSLCPKHYE